MLPLLSLTLIATVISCKKHNFSSNIGAGLNYSSNNNFVINPKGDDSLTSIVYLDNIDFLCDIEEERKNGNNKEDDGYELTRSTIKSVTVLNFKIEERFPIQEHESLGIYLEESVLEIFYGNNNGVKVLGACDTVMEVGLSFDRLTFDVNAQNLTNYIELHPDYKFRIVNTFNSTPQGPRYFRYELEASYSSNYVYKEK